jgi:phage shock protein A
MGFFDWLRGKRETEPVDPVRAFEQRIDALAARAGALRKSAATLLTVRRDLDRQLESTAKNVETAKANQAKATESGDAQAAEVLGADRERFERDREHLQAQRDKVATDATALTEAVRGIEGDLEQLRRERDSARVQLAASNVLARSRPALEDRVDELLQLDAARDEVERAHALAEIYKEDAAKKHGG